MKKMDLMMTKLFFDEIWEEMYDTTCTLKLL